MIRQVSIVPAILSNDSQSFKTQIERINVFARHVQIDVADGTLASTNTLNLDNIWWPKNWRIDLHMITATPSRYLDKIIKMKPSLCIFHAEASEDLVPVLAKLKSAGIKAGVALLPQTYPGKVKPYIDAADHILIFAGQLGMQGSPADLMQMEKIPLVRGMKPEAEIGWDGGANITNVRALAHADLDIINVGSAIARAPDPAAAFQALVAETDKNGVAL